MNNVKFCFNEKSTNINKYCYCNFKNDDILLNECKDVNQFCFMCCDNEIGELNKVELECCYNKCDKLEFENNKCDNFLSKHHLNDRISFHRNNKKKF